MVMVMMLNRSIFCVLFLLLCASCFSNARLHPSGGADEVNVIPVTKVSVVNTIKVRNQVEIEGNLMNKKNAKKNVRKYVKNAKSLLPSSSLSHSNVEINKRSLRTRLAGEIVDGGFVAFTSDYHSPRHHPPKNNK